MSAWAKAFLTIAGLALAMPAMAQARQICGCLRTRRKEHGPRQTMPARARTGQSDDHQRHRSLLSKGQVDGNSQCAR
jgi:hypothetical protein